MSTVDLRPLSMGEILDRTFSIYRRYFLLFVGLAGIPRLLPLGAQLIRTWFVSNVLDHNGHVIVDPNSGVSSLFWFLLLVLGIVTYLFSQGGTVIAVSEIYLGRSTSLVDSFKRVWENFGSLFGVVVLNGLATMGGLALLLVGALWIGCRLLVCVPVALIEGKGPRESLSRSWNLTRDFALKALLILVVYTVILLALSALLVMPLTVMLASSHDAVMTKIWLAAEQVLNWVIEACLTPVLLIATSIFYYDLRVRKEGFDLQFMLDPTSERKTRGDASVPSILG